MKVELMYYNKQFQNKPKGYETANIQIELKQTKIEIEDLSKGLSSGTTFKPALLNGTKSIDWIQQQIFALDFDHDTTIQEQQDKCKELNICPCFGYTSFSHSEQEHHFRLVFCTDKVITNREQRDKLQKILIRLFEKSDKVTFDCTRLFYGGKALIPFDYNNRINADELISIYWKDNFDEIHIDNGMKKINKLSNNIKNYDTSKVDNSHMLKVETIKTLNVDIMKSLLKVGGDKEDNIPYSITPSFQFKSQAELYNYINSIDLCEYLGIYGYVNCILPEHEDNSPSAHIYETDSGTLVYKCFGCNKSYTIIGITEKLAKCKRSEAIEFIKKVYNLELVESDWAKEWKQRLIDCANYITSEEFEITYPDLNKLIRTRKSHIKDILLYFTQYVNEDMQVDNKPFFFASYPTLMKVCDIKSGKSDKMAQSLALFSLLDFIIKLQIGDIPEKELNKAKHIAALHKQKKLTGFYSFEEYGVNLFENSEEIAKVLKENNFTLKGLSREYVLRTFGIELANKVYPQYKHENAQGTSKKSDERTSQIVECIFYCIEQNGYATEKAIVCLLGDKYKYVTTEIQIKKSLQEILVSYNLVRVKASKVNKVKYNLPESINYQSYVICKN